MTPKKFIQTPKRVVEPGEWKVVTSKGGKMPKKAFPLTKTHSYELGRHWHWRVDRLDCDGTPCRLLIAFDPSREEFKAWLSVPRGSDHAVIARLEFHGDHAGWHCHVPCCEISEVDAGQPLARNAVRFPGGLYKHRRQTFDVTEATALQRAFEFFRVKAAPPGALV